MAADPHPRFVLSSCGSYVYDSWYCYREVAHIEQKAEPGHIPLTTAAVCRLGRLEAQRLNAAHDAWLDSAPTKGA